MQLVKYDANSQFLSLQKCRIGVSAAVTLAKRLEGFPITRIDITNNLIGDIGFMGLLQLAKTTPKLVRIDAACNDIGPEGAIALAEEIAAGSSKLEHIDLGTDKPQQRDNSIDAPSGAAIAAAVKNNRTLQFLGLSRNVIGEGGTVACESFAALLHVNTTLKVLKLAANSIGNVGTEILAGGLAQNRTLRVLDLSENGITARGIYSLASCALSPGEGGLKVFSLSKNKLGANGANALAKAIMSNRSLTSLNLSECYICDKGCRVLCEALIVASMDSTGHYDGDGRPYHGIKHLDISNNRITAKGAEYIARLLRRTSLSSINISGNPIGKGAWSIGKALLRPCLRSLMCHISRCAASVLKEDGKSASKVVEDIKDVIRAVTARKLKDYESKMDEIRSSPSSTSGSEGEPVNSPTLISTSPGDTTLTVHDPDKERDEEEEEYEEEEEDSYFPEDDILEDDDPDAGTIIEDEITLKDRHDELMFSPELMKISLNVFASSSISFILSVFAERTAMYDHHASSLTHIRANVCHIGGMSGFLFLLALGMLPNLRSVKMCNNFLTGSIGDLGCRCFCVSSSITTVELVGNSLSHATMTHVHKMTEKNKHIFSLEEPKRLMMELLRLKRIGRTLGEMKNKVCTHDVLVRSCETMLSRMENIYDKQVERIKGSTQRLTQMLAEHTQARTSSKKMVTERKKALRELQVKLNTQLKQAEQKKEQEEEKLEEVQVELTELGEFINYAKSGKWDEDWQEKVKAREEISERLSKELEEISQLNEERKQKSELLVSMAKEALEAEDKKKKEEEEKKKKEEEERKKKEEEQAEEEEEEHNGENQEGEEEGKEETIGGKEEEEEEEEEKEEHKHKHKRKKRIRKRIETSETAVVQEKPTSEAKKPPTKGSKPKPKPSKK
ncbi:hypothetical protein ADUPG1_013846 [Aduncisulcus paluster]|uniref:Uncharacterized protein n=1 Tax=Aduncisulcus paluster TaxID=2918883 RepID=A0ABQ5K6G3_9EUKA|nr:hypothetical protein ADUPG1_013846 [Aduncisulcus paluster]